MRRWSQPARPAWFEDEFADEDLTIGIDRVDHQMQQTRIIGLEALRGLTVSQLLEEGSLTGNLDPQLSGRGEAANGLILDRESLRLFRTPL
jgi:hypothetical protein